MRLAPPNPNNMETWVDLAEKQSYAVLIQEATAEIAAIVTRLLDELPARKVPPKTIPPLRRPEVQARIAERMRLRDEHERMHEMGVPHTH